ncbi:MAG: chromosome segregation protein SMC [Myxococcota bacterium]
MRIKSLQVQGFKSFVDKVVFEFRPGITAIVGPNGCGKSNVVDAMRWAMGEQSPRRLRGRGMEDVIFTGSDSRAALGMAEVVLSFDNSAGMAPAAFSQFSEIQISRRLYRSGESEYLINKVPTRLRDVLDFFRDTGIGTRGYTIVEQGQIAQVVSAKAEERRALIEEAAGIGKYKARRREAERKLEATEQNLLRVTDVLGEIRRQISSIERQARKAARYKRLRERLRQLELSLAADERASLQTEVEAARRRRVSLRDEVTGGEAQVAEREAELERLRLNLTEREKHLGQGSETLFELRSRIRELESSISYDRRERASLAEANESRGGEIERLREQSEAAARELSELEDELTPLEAGLAAELDRVGRAQTEAEAAEKELRSLEAERESSQAALVEVLTGIARSEDRLASGADRRAEIAQSLRSTDELLEVQQGEASQASVAQRKDEEGLRQLLGERDRLMVALRDALTAHERAGARAREATEALRGAREGREVRRARLESLREIVQQRQDLQGGTRHLLEGGEGLGRRIGLRAVLRDVLEVAREDEAALEAVLADRAGALLVERPQGALEALRALREAGAGCAVLVAQPHAEAAPVGFVPLGEPLLDRVRVREGYEEVVRALLGGVNRVEDLAEVLSVYGEGRLPATFVTPAGDVLGADGVVRGGAGNDAGGLLARQRELRELDREVAELEARVIALEPEAVAAESELERAGEELDNLRNRHHTAALAVANREKDLERTRERAKAIGEAQEGRFAERSGLLAQIDSLVAEQARLEESLAEARHQRSDRQRSVEARALRIGSANREVSRLQAALGERRVEHAGRAERCERLGQARDRAATARRETLQWIERREEETRAADARRGELASAIEAAEAELTRGLEEEEGARQSHDERRDAYERAAAEARTLEEHVRELRVTLGSKREAAGQAELTQRETEMRLSHLEESVRERWGIDLASWSPSEAPPESVDEEEPDEPGEGTEAEAGRESGPSWAEIAGLPQPEREKLVRETRSRLESLGEVNLSAIDEHEELGERFRFLSEQRSDLEGSVSQLREAIARINRTSRRRFKETFDAVDACFRENFPRLFRGGKAGLSLTESEDVLEAGIEIMAQPPGKRLQNVNLLSGGEKTLTALALLIAVFQVRPSPFFLLDEVDAALDDANVGRFNDIVREMAKESQFLIITHNKRTIEVSDVLYGVTMEEKGVSKLVSVELAEATA